MALNQYLSKKLLAVILAAVFVVSACITTLLVFTQVLPDQRARRPSITRTDTSGGETGSGGGDSGNNALVVPPKQQADAREYTESWTQAVEAGVALSIDLFSIGVDLSVHDGNELLLEFTGWAYPLRDGQYPELFVTSHSSRITVDETRTRDSWNSSYRDNEGRIDGVLTVKLPRGVVGDLRIDTFSGEIQAQDLQASAILVDTSSGNVTLANTTASGACTVDTFSGAITLTGVTAAHIGLDSSSGDLRAKEIKGDKFVSSQFSGSILLAGGEIRGDAEVSTSSGRVELSDFSCGELSVDTFSGEIQLTNATAGGDIDLSTSSGGVTLTGVTCEEMEVETFSGRISGEALTTGKIDADTSSGGVALTLTRGCDISVETFSGSVTLTTPESFGFRLEYDTFSGGHTVGFPITLDGREDGKGLSGTVGDGRHKVEVNTSSGSLTIQPAS